FQARFKQTLGDDFLQLVTDRQPVSLSLLGASRASSTVKGSGIEYANALPHVNARYDVGSEAVEETLELQDAGAASSFRSLLKAPAGTTAERMRDGSWGFRSPGRAQPAFFLTTPVAFDSARQRSLDPTTSHASLDVKPAEGGFEVDLGVDEAWLKDPARRFPVFVDPTLSIQPDSSDASFASDCSNCTPFVDSSGGRMFIGTDDSHVWRQALQFDLSALPAGVTVSGASLGVYFDGFCLSVSGAFCGGVGHQIDVHRMTAAWSSSSTSSQVQFDPAVTSSFTLPSGAGDQWMSWDVGGVVSAWETGSQPNDGFYLMLNSEPLGASGPAPPGRLFSGDASLTPQLTVTFSGDAVALDQPSVQHANGAELSWSRYTGPSGAA